MLDAIDAAGGAATREQLRAALRLRNERLGTVLADLASRAVIVRGARVVGNASAFPFPVRHIHRNGTLL